MTAPDRIWAEDCSKEWLDDTGAWGVSKENGSDREYLASTPAREKAEELLAANKKWHEFAGRILSEYILAMSANHAADFSQALRETKALITSIEEETGE